jgi:hypothetical protein
MEAEPSAASASQRPRPFLLVLLAVVAGAAALMWLRPSAGPSPPASYPARTPPPQQAAGRGGEVDPSTLDLRLEALESERTAPGDSERNPFRFREKPPPPPAERPPRGAGREPDDLVPSGPPPPPAPPPIGVKFLGTIQLADGTVLALFTDCSQGGRRTEHVKEGGVVLGQYRLVKIGVESAIVEHLDGRGRTTIPQTGQECVWK